MFYLYYLPQQSSTNMLIKNLKTPKTWSWSLPDESEKLVGKWLLGKLSIIITILCGLFLKQISHRVINEKVRKQCPIAFKFSGYVFRQQSTYTYIQGRTGDDPTIQDEQNAHFSSFLLHYFHILFATGWWLAPSAPKAVHDHAYIGEECSKQ